MKNRFYISTLIVVMLGVTSCQKKEFQELYESSSEIEEQRVADESQITTSQDGSFITEEPRLILRDRIEVTGVVKEVSDGDEESDDDENKTQE